MSLTRDSCENLKEMYKIIIKVYFKNPKIYEQMSFTKMFTDLVFFLQKSLIFGGK